MPQKNVGWRLPSTRRFLLPQLKTYFLAFFLAAGFLVAGFFLAAGFLAAGFFLAGAFFFAVANALTPFQVWSHQVVAPTVHIFQ